MTAPRFEAVLFDCDGVLVDSEPIVNRVLLGMLHELDWVDTPLTREARAAEFGEAVAELVEDGLLEQRRGAGTFVRPTRMRMEHSLSSLLSFTEYMRQRGKIPTSRILSAGLYAPMPDEQQALGLMTLARVARIERLRSADGVPMALEYSSWPADILPDPQSVQGSLYDHVRALGHVPTHAVQRVSAANLKVSEAQLLNMQAGQAVLRIDRTGYLASGRPVEFTRGLYRSDIYDFIAELRLEASPAT